MRLLLGMGLVLVLACGVSAGQDKIDAKKLIGKWERPADKEKKQTRLVAEFTDKGKVKFIFGDTGTSTEQQYEVIGKEIQLTVRSKDGDIKRTLTITKLTDEVLITTEAGEKIEYARLKDEKDPKKP